jgi:hypothetical protein
MAAARPTPLRALWRAQLGRVREGAGGGGRARVLSAPERPRPRGHVKQDGVPNLAVTGGGGGCRGMVTPTPIGRSPQSRRDDVTVAVPDVGGRGDHGRLRIHRLGSGDSETDVGLTHQRRM